MLKLNDLRKNEYYIMALLIMTSVYFLNFNIDIGFAFKPYMWMSAIGIVFLFFKNRNNLKNLSSEGIKSLRHNLLTYEKLYILFFLFAVIRGLFSKFYIDSIKMSVALITVIFLYFVLYSILKKLDIPKIMNLLFISGMIFAVLSLTFFLIGVESAGFLDRGIYRLTGLVQDPNIFILFITPVYSVTLYKIINKEYKYIAPFAFILIPMFLSYSRGGLIGIFIVTVLIVISNLSRDSLKKLILFTICIAFVVIILFMFTNINDTIHKTVGIDILDTLNRRMGGDGSGSGRIPLWKHGIYFFTTSPLIGIGLYNFRQYNQLFFNNPRYVHNVFVEILCENGIIGSSIFILFLVSFMKNKSTCKEGKIIKFIIISQLAQLFFLSGLSSEVVYMMFAVYKSVEFINLKESKS
ncbi:O-antigen ligase family protein [Paraclostridium ghonii]|uniref:O-antigen ligase n=1 Tax=Paraclostridium ghonii TaxID=29358 RepID=A0ABU0MVF1_9FIRM|nr:O-antigen ligase family protein [Paeniclostridium ghonii]MDQ0554896.1 O-antigen ligase [Paeniclostridium ghonii]